MKKERIYYLDLIKIIAVICVFTCHFTRSLELNQVGFPVKILPDTRFQVYLGSFGVSLFFIISGAALLYVYEEKLDPGSFYKKRLMGIYPMFWMAFLIAFGISLFRDKMIPAGVPQWKIIYSILGIDGNALWWGPNYYQLGEWFLGVITCLYLIFPLLRAAMKKSPVLTGIAVAVIYVLSLLFYNEEPMPMSCFVPARIPELYFGMVYIRYIRKTRAWQMVLGIVILGASEFFSLGTYGATPVTTFVGIGSFFIFSWIFQHVPTTELMKRLAGFCGKYCYAFFLTHHYLLIWLTSRFNGCILRKAEVIMLYVSCLAVVLLASWLLYRLHGSVMSFLKTEKA